jgi:hypothetical protein
MQREIKRHNEGFFGKIILTEFFLIQIRNRLLVDAEKKGLFKKIFPYRSFPIAQLKRSFYIRSSTTVPIK